MEQKICINEQYYNDGHAVEYRCEITGRKCIYKINKEFGGHCACFTKSDKKAENINF